jgi:glycosidase
MQKILPLLVIAGLLAACAKPAPKAEPAKPVVQSGPALEPEWAKNANIYEVNIRQYTPEGTFNAFAGHLPRLQQMGVDILWFMPIFPISETKKKGSLGSYYAVTDFRNVNHKFGTMDDFRAVVAKAHELGMKVVLDWVPNHTGWDHVWIKSNPDFYSKDATTDTIIHPAGTDWTDVADLNYDNPALREAMVQDLLFWVKEMDVDGYRMDVAGEVPNDFWAGLRPRLDSAKNLFMLAEWGDKPEHFETGFNMNYGWPFKDVMLSISSGKKPATEVAEYLKRDSALFPAHAYHMMFIANHDENSWNGLPMVFGAGEDAFAVLAFTLHGMPLIYSGQESGLKKKLSFFEKDSIDWGNFSKQGFYQTLLSLKKRNQALWNGLHGGKPMILPTGSDEQVVAYTREKNGDKVLVVINLSAKAQSVTLAIAGKYNNVFTGKEATLTAGQKMALKPWEYLVLEGVK